MGNSLVVAVIKLTLTKFAVPPVATRLARDCRDHHVKPNEILPPEKVAEKAISVLQTQLFCMLMFNVTTMLLAPLIAVFLLDESCLRHYLSFADSLRELFDIWGIAQQGPAAYRTQFCSRQLVTEFSYGDSCHMDWCDGGCGV